MKALKIVGIIAGIIIALGIVISIADPMKDGSGKLDVFHEKARQEIEQQVEIKDFPTIDQIKVTDIPGGANLRGAVETQTGQVIEFSFNFVDSAGTYQMTGGLLP